jgi:hypothetical protein
VAALIPSGLQRTVQGVVAGCTCTAMWQCLEHGVSPRMAFGRAIQDEQVELPLNGATGSCCC